MGAVEVCLWEEFEVWRWGEILKDGERVRGKGEKE